MKCLELSARAMVRITMIAVTLTNWGSLLKAEEAASPKFYAGAEMPWLQVQNSAYSYERDTDSFRTPHFGQHPSLRFWGGYESRGGLGFRASYWDFQDNTGQTVTRPDETQSQAVIVYTVDLEAIQRARFHGFDILASGGVRFGGLEQSSSSSSTNPSNPYTQSNTQDFDGAGLTFGGGLSRQIGHSRFNMYGNLRGSILFGDTDINRVYSYTWGSGEDGFMIQNQSVLIWETRLGLEYNHPTSYGNWFGRVGVEAQLWELAGGGFRESSSGGLGFFGPTFAVGFKR